MKKICSKILLSIIKKRVFFKPINSEEFDDLYYFPQIAFQLKTYNMALDTEIIPDEKQDCQIVYEKTGDNLVVFYQEEFKNAGQVKQIISQI